MSQQGLCYNPAYLTGKKISLSKRIGVILSFRNPAVMSIIGIDVRKIRDYGIGSYIFNLLGHLPSCLESTFSVTLFCFPADDGLISSISRRFRIVHDRAPKYSIREQWSMYRNGRKQRLSLLHCPHYVVPLVKPTPLVVTIHDINHLLFPEYLPSMAARVYARRMIRTAVRKADAIITVSHSAKHDLVQNTDVSVDKIHVIHNGVERRFSVLPDTGELPELAMRFQLPRRMILYIGNTRPHKNLSTLLEAFALFKRRDKFDTVLAIVGRDIFEAHPLQRLSRKLGLGEYVRFLGFLKTEDLSLMYRLADLFVFPSLYEGFGLPPLEAMASGTGVVASDIPSLREVTGEAALLVDPRNPEAWASAMEKMLGDDMFRKEKIRKGIIRAAEFSWEKACNATCGVYKEVLRRGEGNNGWGP